MKRGSKDYIGIIQDQQQTHRAQRRQHIIAQIQQPACNAHDNHQHSPHRRGTPRRQCPVRKQKQAQKRETGSACPVSRQSLIQAIQNADMQTADSQNMRRSVVAKLLDSIFIKISGLAEQHAHQKALALRLQIFGEQELLPYEKSFISPPKL